MTTNMTEITEELDDASLGEHLRNTDVLNFADHGYLQFQNYDKSSDSRWTNLLSRQKGSIDETSPQPSHLSPEASTISELASFEYNQRLPSLESSSSAPICRAACGLTTQPLFAWQPFGGTTSSLHSQASSLHGPGGHLFPLVSGATYNPEFPSQSPSAAASAAALSLACASQDSRDKSDPQFNPLTYANVSAALAASGRLRVSAASPIGHDLQPIRMDLGPSTANQSGAAATSVAANYAPSVGSSNSQCSTPAHQGFGFSSNGPAIVQQLSTGANNGMAVSHSFDDHSKSANFKQRSKKESHNRIERKRRDYINSQIVYLSSLLPPELYRDVDGRRNKGSVLRLSVNYIKELRDAVSRMSGLKQENALARQLIPLLLKRIETLERVIQDPNNSTGSVSSSTGLHHSASFESLYQSWLLASESNQRVCSTNGNSVTPGGSSSRTGPSFTSPLNEANFFPDLIQGETDSTDLELSLPTTTVSSSNSRLINVKREQTEEDRLAESAPSRVHINPCRGPVHMRSNFNELSAMTEEEAVNPMNAVNFESQSNLSYERYHRLMQPTCQSGVYGQNE